MQVAEVLIKAKALIDTPEKWTKGTYARDQSGTDVDYEDVRATCFCTYGAVYKIAGKGSRAIRALLVTIPSLTNTVDIVSYNDAPDRAHSEIMDWFDRAIERAKQSE